MAEKGFKYVETTHVREGRLLISIDSDGGRSYYKEVRIRKMK